jgi:hypothetical protein
MRTSRKSVIGKKSLIDGILNIRASEMLRVRIAQGLLKLEVLVAEAIDLTLQ